MNLLIGKWKSELGSVLNVESIENNQLVGTFTTHTGSTQGTYLMAGSIGFDENLSVQEEGGAIGWSVSWNSGKSPENSVTTWTGQLCMNADGDTVIVATWLYSRGTKPDENWNSTLIGSNTFVRIE